MIQWILKHLGADSTKPAPDDALKPLKAASLPANRRIMYRLTDPIGNPVLCKEEVLTEPIAPFFHVVGFVGGGYGLETPQGQAASLYMNLDRAIKNYNTFAEKPLKRWTAVSVLPVIPRAGRKLNAFYNRRTLSFFFDKDKLTDTDVFTADSPDVTVHELGHAILDAKRPDFWNIAVPEVAAFHESWGDVFSFISQLQHPEVAEAVLQLTNGDLRVANVISSMGEQIGQTIYHSVNMGNAFCMRSAINTLQYVDHQTLPKTRNKTDQIFADSHSFSRILTGTLYDLMVTIYETEISAGKTPLVALLDAAKGLGWYVDRAIARTPATTYIFRAFAEALLQVDKDMSQSYYQERFATVLRARNLLTHDLSIKLLSSPGPSHPVYVRLSDALAGARKVEDGQVVALEYNPLYNLEVQLPDEGWQSVIAGKQFVDYLNKNNLVGQSSDTPFEILDGKLVRSHFNSGCYFQNWLNPTQPEYYKPPKPWNHFCPCGCKENLEEAVNGEATKRIVREKNTRQKQIFFA